MLASLLNKYNIKHNIPGLPPPINSNNPTSSSLITKLGQTQNLHSKMILDTPFSSIEFPYVRWDQFLKCYMDDIIFSVPKEQEGANTLMLIMTILVLHALQEVGFIVSGSKVSLEHNEFKFLGVTINTDTNYSVITNERVQAISTWRQPRNVAETDSRLAILNYYSTYLVGLK